MVEGAIALTRMSGLHHLFGERDRERRHRRLAGGIRDHAGARAPFERGAGRDIDDAAARPGAHHGGDGGPAAEERGDEIHVDLLHQIGFRRLVDGAHGKAAGDDGSKPTASARRRKACATALLLRELDVGDELDLRVIAERKALGFRAAWI